MKICLINNLYKPYNRGGAEQIVKLQADGLTKAGHEVFIISTKPLFAQCATRNANRKIYYLSGFYYNIEKIPKILRLFWHVLDIFDIGSYLKIKRILKKEKPDVVITHNLKGIGYLIPKAIKCLNIKHVHILHDVQLLHPSGLIICGKEKKYKNFLARIYAKTCAWLFNSPDIVISPSNWLLQIHTDNNFFKNSKKIVLPNPTPVSSKNYLLKKEKTGDEVFRFLYVGQITKHKGILFLIKLFNILCNHIGRCQIQLLIAGQGPALKQAKKIAYQNQAIKFLGQASQEEVKKIMSEANCLVVPSICYENSPTVIYEAASQSLPVIASRLGGITELIHELGGLLFKPGNEGDLMHQMTWAINNPKKLAKISQKSQATIKKFSIENYIKKLLETI